MIKTRLIEISGIIETSIADGPGVRTVLFLQGCNFKCKGCHNQKIWQHGQGKWLTILQLMDFIRNHCHNKKITISGGEPLEQLDALYELLLELKKHTFNTCLYTGFELGNVPLKILTNLDYIKTGKFEEKMKSYNLQFFGSTNQKLFTINTSKEEGLICKEIMI